MQESLTSKLRKLVSPGAGRLIPGAANARTVRMFERAGANAIMIEDQV